MVETRFAGLWRSNTRLPRVQWEPPREMSLPSSHSSRFLKAIASNSRQLVQYLRVIFSASHLLNARRNPKELIKLGHILKLFKMFHLIRILRVNFRVTRLLLVTFNRTVIQKSIRFQ